jgi:hypothetical protein
MSHGILEIAWIRKSVGANRTEFWKHEMALEYFEDVSTRTRVQKQDREYDSPRHNNNLSWRHVQDAHFREDAQASFLCNNQKVAISVIE